MDELLCRAEHRGEGDENPGGDCSDARRDGSAVQHRQAAVVVALALYPHACRQPGQVIDLVGAQAHRGRAGVLVEALAATRAGDRHDPRPLRQQPSQGDLPRRASLRVGEAAHPRHERRRPQVVDATSLLEVVVLAEAVRVEALGLLLSGESIGEAG